MNTCARITLTSDDLRGGRADPAPANSLNLGGFMYGQDIEFLALVYLVIMALIGAAALLEWLANRKD